MQTYTIRIPCNWNARANVEKVKEWLRTSLSAVRWKNRYMRNFPRTKICFFCLLPLLPSSKLFFSVLCKLFYREPFTWTQLLIWWWFSTLRYLIRVAWHTLGSLLFVGPVQSNKHEMKNTSYSTWTSLFLLFKRFDVNNSHLSGTKCCLGHSSLPALIHRNWYTWFSLTWFPLIDLISFNAMLDFYTPRKREKAFDFLW